VAAAILDYRKKQGLFIDPEEEAKWMAAYTSGMEMMQVCILCAVWGCLFAFSQHRFYVIPHIKGLQKMQS